MKKTIIVLVAITTLAACAKKNTPAASSAATTTMASTAVEAAKPSKEAAAGMEIYTAKCGRCHELKKVENYTAAEWVPIMDDMAVKAKLDATEKANVTSYVQFYAKAAK